MAGAADEDYATADGDADASGPGLGLLLRSLRFFTPYWNLSLIVFLSIGISSVLALVPAVVTRDIIDLLARRNADFGLLTTLISISVGAAVVAGLVGAAAEYLRARIGEGIMLSLRDGLVDRLLRQSLGFFADRRSGDVLSRMNNDVNGVRNVVDQTVFGVVENVLVTVATLALMFAFDWGLTVFVLVLLPAFALPAKFAGNKTYKISSTIQERLADITSRMQEVLGISGALLVKAFGTENRERRRLRGLNKKLYDLEIRKTVIVQWYAQGVGALQTIGPALVWTFGGYQVIKGNVTLGTMITLNTILVPRLYRSFAELGNLHLTVTSSLALFRRLFTYLDLKPNVADAPHAVDLPQVTGSVRCEHVTFSYPGQLAPAVNDVSFGIEPGRLVALVGPSGAGKSTLTSLLCRFYDPQQGRILLDGHNLRDIRLAALGRHFGIVSQETFLFHDTIRANLSYARPDASQADLDAAVAAACLEDVVARLPAGYDTVVGERGFRLSGGEKQRVAIARVILKNPRVLILDEATSHLDSISEQLIQTALKSLFAGRTALVVAHRLSTVLAADLILVMDHGHIVERGTHAELIDGDGLYREIYQRQFSTG